MTRQTTETSKQGITPQKTISDADFRNQYYALKKEFGKKKKLPRGYGLQALIALSGYPELKDVEIEFKFTSSKKNLSTTPFKPTLLLPANARKYEIQISIDTNTEKKPVLLRNLNFNMQVGQLAHELGHVVDFLEKTGIEVVGSGIGYFSNSYKKKLEKTTDMRAVEHGFGYQILEYSELIKQMLEKYPAEKYYQSYYQFYLTPIEIREAMKKIDIYD